MSSDEPDGLIAQTLKRLIALPSNASCASRASRRLQLMVFITYCYFPSMLLQRCLMSKLMYLVPS